MRAFPGYRMDPPRALRAAAPRRADRERAGDRRACAGRASGRRRDPRARARARTGTSGSGDGVVVRTDKGCYEAERLVLTAGAWIGELAARSAHSHARAPGSRLAATVAAGALRARALPGVQPRGGGRPLLRLPDLRGARFQVRPLPPSGRNDAGRGDAPRGRRARTKPLLRAFAERYFPDGAGPTMALRTCMFTNTPDEHFIIDLIPSAAGGARFALFRPWLQILFSDRRDPGRSRDRRRDHAP